MASVDKHCYGAVESAGVSDSEDVGAEAKIKNFRAHAGSYTTARVAFVYIGLCLVMMVTMLDKDIEAAVQPNVLSKLGSLNEVGTVAMVTYMVGAVSHLMWAKLSDIAGRRETFFFCSLTYCGGNLLCASSLTFPQYLLGMSIAYAGVMGLWIMCQITIADLVPLRHRGKWQGYLEIDKVIMAWAGPVIGGIVLSINWRYIYVLLCVTCAFAVVPIFASLRLPRLKPVRFEQGQGVFGKMKAIFRALDLAGFALLCIFASGILLAMKNGGKKWDWYSAQTFSLLGVGVVSGACLIMYEWRVSLDPLLPRILFNKTATGSFMVVVTLRMSSMTHVTYQSLYYQVVMDYDATHAGLAHGFYSTSAVIAAILVGYGISLDGKYLKWMRLGTCIFTLGQGLSALVDRDTSYAFLSLTNALLGFGGGMITCPALVAVQGASLTHHVATATALFGFFKYFGSALGIAGSSVLWRKLIENEVLSHSSLFSEHIDVEKVVKNIQYIKHMPHTDRELVVDIYEHAWRVSMMVSTLAMCVVLFAGVRMQELEMDTDLQHFDRYRTFSDSSRSTVGSEVNAHVYAEDAASNVETKRLISHEGSGIRQGK
ncbi:hypothetical protein SARC_00165 [Sphaeroforma arctica JP610]|uniref:Major facilitator superfamily (MFS) profile domain-containing protein n=1 Tax=Sphaeroforma arctica JP610 TaxID=667725 RepID=A0A0L0GFX4_9EUKA|nr:hypothetical protein SARC_00165 [Sphaeroforma arctica JP610]KNC87731.1 hypothetical protein SARC_00165 [Sphaeroforma arctica JP610]|eukprot:XP_014161633.1 hypothetical protein SARC_00165 [Sphaeroforma arctica JP610]